MQATHQPTESRRPSAVAPPLRAVPAASAPQPPRGRIAALDAARALGVLAMVFGHTLDALLAPAVRATAGVELYWKARGFTAPLFLMVSGWAVTVAISRGRARGLDIPRGRIGRVLLLLGIGYALRWPGWGVERLAAGELDVWAHFLSFDALHTIALALLAASLVLALPWSRREHAWAIGALGLLCIALGMLAPAPVVPGVAELPRSLPALALRQAAGGTSPFPLFPWAAYFFVGALVGLLAGTGGGRSAAGMALVGAVLVAGTIGTGVGEMPMGHPLLFTFRSGAVLLVLAALSTVPAAWAARLAPVGRASLGVYAIHVPVVYGWSTFTGLTNRIGPQLGLGSALLVATAVLLGSFAVNVAFQRVRSGLVAAAATGWERVRLRLESGGRTEAEGGE
ncbi:MULTISPECIES: acyltransferase [unclassified Anaeromyxobacter]|uniref:acyltransferase family protein n=1 Tax=unclassified Anaeromyxobacter TaxID=2620896 RepID=UPI0021082BF2|nr:MULTISPECIES: acyltransferase [unclassified Anaeromyxobacter]